MNDTLRHGLTQRRFAAPSGERHWEILRGLLREGQIAGPLVMDVVIAAIALEHGATLCTTDGDFSRFSGLKWTNPLVVSP